MSYTYKKLKDSKTGNELDLILRKEDNAFIPKNNENQDYQEYLEWAKTNTIEAAD